MLTKPISWIELSVDSVKWQAEIDNHIRQHERYCLPDFTYLGKTKVDITQYKTGPSTKFDYKNNKTKISKTKSTMFVSKYDDKTKQSSLIKQLLNLKCCHHEFRVQNAGGVVGPHVDSSTGFTTHIKNNNFRNTTTWDIKKFVIFLDDWKMGQTFMFGKSALTNWKQFDTYTWPWYLPHATANASEHQRPLLEIVGI